MQPLLAHQSAVQQLVLAVVSNSPAGFIVSKVI